MMTLDMMKLRERFLQHPLLPDEVIQQQNRWRQRWNLPARGAEPGESWDFYFDPSVIQSDPDNDPRRRLHFNLRRGERLTKSFITGSKGAGKSTTAFSLWADPRIVRHYTLIGFNLQDYLNVADADPPQLIAVMIAHLVERISEAQIGADLADPTDRETIRKLKEILDSVKPSARVEQVNVHVFGWFTAIFKESSTARDAFRKYMLAQAEEVMSLFDRLNALLEDHTKKHTLFVVDDLDKIAADQHYRMFQLQLSMLLRPRCAALYSYPIEVDRDPRFTHLKQGQPNRYLLANVKLADVPGGPMRHDGRQVMDEFVRLRLGGARRDEVITLTQAEWDRVLHYSAGNFRELSRIISHAFEIAAMTETPTADRRCFESALRRLRQDYNYITEINRFTLQRIRSLRQQPIENEFDPELLSTLLAAFVVVEYPNEPGWLGVNPIVDDLLDGRKSLLAAPE